MSSRPMACLRDLPARAATQLGLKSADRAGSIPWRVLRDGGAFRWYFAGSVVSDFGTWLQNTAQVVLAYQLEHSVLLVGLVTFAQFTSPLVLGPWAGVAADRFGGRRILLGTQITSAVAAAALAALDFSGALNAVTLVAGAMVSGLAFTFALPARNVTVQRLVSPDKLTSAYAMDAVSYNLGRAIAPLVTMTVGMAGVNFAWAFAGNALTFAAFSVILWRTRLHVSPEPERRSRVRDGFRIACRDSRIMILLLMVAAVTVADDPILVLGPELARQLHTSPAWSGWFIAALGAGTVCGSFRRSKHQATLRLAAAALAALALCMLLFVFAPTMWAAVAAAMGAGMCCLVANSVTRTALAVRAGRKELPRSWPCGRSRGLAPSRWPPCWTGRSAVASAPSGRG